MRCQSPGKNAKKFRSIDGVFINPPNNGGRLQKKGEPRIPIPGSRTGASAKTLGL